MGKKKIVKQSEKDLLKNASGPEAAAAKSSPSGGSKKFEKGKIYVKASYNNTIVTVTNAAGDTVAWASAGSLGFSGPKKATPFAASKVIEAISEKLRRTGPFDVDIIISGIGSGRDSAIRSLINRGFNPLSLRDVTPVPHNGPRPKKVRRV
ncbi:MAG: 30S ribosomal protein S11 [Parcubacteria group bacterium]|nr:30S ribosomal protein S11 [Parcubacteria group bacterium]